MGYPSDGTFLVSRVSDLLVAIPISCVVETLRPLGVTTVPDLAHFVEGIAVIRGVTTPVISAARLFGKADPPPASRFITLRVFERRVALAVEEVLGVRRLDGTVLGTLPPLCSAVRHEVIEGIGVLDAQLLAILGTGHIVPEAVWQRLAEFAAS